MASQRVTNRQERIRLKKEALEEKIGQFTTELEKLQAKCSHPFKSGGPMTPYGRRYFTCEDCGKNWEGQRGTDY